MFRRSQRLATRRPQQYRTRLLLQGLEERAVPATNIIVSDLGDAGPGTLRQALVDANSEIAPYDGVDTITFTVAGTIALTTGELVASKAVVITGPGAGLLTLKQTTANSRVLNIDNALAGGEVFDVSGLTFTGGNRTGGAAADRGGAIGVGDETVTLTDCVVTGNTTNGGGGGVGTTTTSATTINLVSCTVSNNSATGAGVDGGGVRLTTGQTLTLDKCSITGNSSSDDGAGVYMYKAAGFTATNTTIAGNRALSFTSDGGGVRFGQVATGLISFTNCTIANNFAGEYGGGVNLSTGFTGTLDFNYCTIVGNTANLNGGGISRETTVSATTFANTVTITLNGTVVAENSGFVNPDFYAINGTLININNSAIGNLEGFIATVGASAIAPGTRLQLGSLADNGGPVPTILPAPGSPLVNQGGAPGTPTTDARGFARINGAAADIGAAETKGTEAVAQLAAPLALVERPGGATTTVTVTYTDDTAVKFSTITASNVTVTGPFGVTVALGTVTPAADAKSITATYLLTPPGGSWDDLDNGTYTISLANNVQDASGAMIPAATLGQIAVAVGKSFLVMNDAASGPGSLAQAVADAQAGTPGLTDVIRFDPAFFAAVRTINLSAPITINDTLYIEGSGKDLLNIRPAAANDRAFITDDGSKSKFSNITFAGMTIKDCAPVAGVGGAVQIDTEWVTFRDVRLTNNKSAPALRGAAIGSPSTGSGAQSTKVLIYNSEISNNSVNGTTDGGAVGFSGNSINNYLLIKDSLISGNTANRRGGVFYGINAAVCVDGSLLTGNQSGGAEAYGGSLMFFGSSRSNVIRNSTITSNKTVGAIGGGGAAVLTNDTFSGTVGIYNSTISGNSSASKGGAISRLGATGFVILVDTILDGNTAVTTGPNANGVVESFRSLIGDTAGATVNDIGATSQLNVSANLSPLYNFGGALSGYATLPGSPAREGGTASGHAFDQRGAGFPRVVDAADIGALEFGASTPIPVIGALASVTTLGVPDYTFTITYNDDAGIEPATINDDEIHVTGPGGYDVLAKFVVGSGAGPLTAYTATYQVLAPGGSWDFSENGFYTVGILAGKVADGAANPIPGVTFGTFKVGLPQTLIVTNANDSGNGSLRAAFATANAAAGATTINFDPTFFATAKTIALTTGELLVANDVVLNGTGMSLLTISGNNAGRIFNVSNVSAVIGLTVSGVTLRDGKLFRSTDNGGAILNNGENLTLSNVTLTNNGTVGDGGAVYSLGGSFVFDDGTASGNSATGGGGDGGFAFVTTGGTMTMQRSTVSGNYAFDGGGGLYISGTATLTATDCTISGNVADAATTAIGGGVYLGATANGTFTNCTISGNSAALSGGGIRLNSGTLTLNSSTVAANVARNVLGGGAGGGIFRIGTGTGVVNLNGSVVADNLVLNAGTGNDIFATAVNVTDSAVFDANGFAPSGPLAVPSGTPLLLGPLAKNGGATMTHLPAPTSPLRNAGALVASGASDQRGLPRLVGAQQDVGSVEADGIEPVAILTPVADVTTAGGTVLQFVVTYYDDGTIAVGTLDGNDVRVTGANGFDAPASFVSSAPVAGGVEATYQFTPPGGTWNSPDAGAYSIALQAGQVTDNTSKAVTAATLGGFRVQLARNYVVTNASEAGAGSLRQAVLDSNANQVVGSVDTITFDGVFFATPKTITLATGDLTLTDSVKIFGPGAKLLTVATTGFSRHFSINGLTTLVVQIEDMTLTGGKSFGGDALNDAGGSVYIRDENVTLNRMIFSNNSTIQSGGAIFPDGAATVLTINDSLLTGNTGTNGGAIRLPTVNNVTAVNTTFSGNTATTAGGAISNSGFLTLVNCTVAFNTALSATGGGGLRNVLNTITLEGTLVTNNTASAGPDINAAFPVTANDSLIGNSALSLASGSNLLMDVDAKISPLADNGGPTKTHAIPATSPAFNAGSNFLALPFDQRGPGFDRSKLGGVDIGAFELQALAVPPTLTTIKINNGAVQRSLVTSITVTFSEAVAFPSGIAAAFAVTRTGPGPLTGAVNLVLTPSGNDVVITFAAGGAVGIEAGKSLLDGNYTLTVNADKISGVGGTLDGNANGTADGSPTDDRTQALHRLFGDSDGDKDVDIQDFTAFRQAFGNGPSIFDNDGDGDTDLTDFGAFRSRFGTSVP